MNPYENLPIALNAAYLEPNVTREMIEGRADLLRTVDSDLRNGTCKGSDFTGWLQPDRVLAPYDLARMKASAKRLANDTDYLVVLGMGGSYLGARALIEALSDEPGKVIY